MKDSYFLTLAKRASEKSDHHTQKLGCVIAKGSSVLGVGYNVLKTHPKSPSPYRQIHAEFMAYVNAGGKVEGATAYIYRQHKNGQAAVAKPCQSCWNFLTEMGIKNVVYSFEGHYKKERMK